MGLEHIHGKTFHGRHGAVKNAFTYGVDYVLTDFADTPTPSLFSYDRFNLAAMHSRDHGGPRGAGYGCDWVRAVLIDQGFTHLLNGHIALLAQPRIWGHVFNPVSFWLVYDERDQLSLVIAEVNNTFGDRHSYLCYNDKLSPITRSDTLSANCLLYTSPSPRDS